MATNLLNQRISMACTLCISSKVKCGTERPCKRCIKRNTESQCVNRKVMKVFTPISRNRINGAKKACILCAKMKLRCTDEDRPCLRCKSSRKLCIDNYTVLNSTLVLPISAARLFFTPSVLSQEQNKYRLMHLAVSQCWKSGWRQYSLTLVASLLMQPIRIRSLLAFASISLPYQEINALEKDLILFVSEQNLINPIEKNTAFCFSQISSAFSTSEACSSESVYKQLRTLNAKVTTDAYKLASPNVSLSELCQGQGVIKIGFHYDTKSKLPSLYGSLNKEAEIILGITSEFFQSLIYKDDARTELNIRKRTKTALKEAPYFWRLFHPLNWPTIVQLTWEMWINVPEEPISATMDLIGRDGRVLRAFSKWQTIHDKVHGGFNATIVNFMVK